MNAVPNSLATASAPFNGMSRKQLQMGIAYALQQIAKNTMTPNQLVAAATCFSCLSDFDVALTKTYLLWQIAGGVVNPVTDPDVAAFILCSGITDPTQIGAVTTLVASLKSASLWTLFDAIYPFVGGTATSNSCNLKNPALYSITWHGGVTHNANGVTGDGSTGYGDTGLNLSTASNYSLNSAALSFYSRTATLPGTGSFMACSDGASNSAGVSRNAFAQYSLFGINEAATIAGTISTFRGNNVFSRTASNAQAYYTPADGTVSDTGVTVGRPNANMAILAFNNNGGISAFAAANLAFAGISAGFSAGQVATLQPIITTYETTLGRA